MPNPGRSSGRGRANNQSNTKRYVQGGALVGAGVAAGALASSVLWRRAELSQWIEWLDRRGIDWPPTIQAVMAVFAFGALIFAGSNFFLARKTMKRAHRAWITFGPCDIERHVNPDGRIALRLLIKNTGKTPATRVHTDVATSVIGDTDMRAPGDGSPGTATIVAPEGDVTVLTAIAPEHGGRFTNENLSALLAWHPPILHARFTVAYLDGFDQRETEVCNVWDAHLLATAQDGTTRVGAFRACLEHEHFAT